VRAAAVAALLAAWAPCAARAAEDPVEQRRSAIAKELVRLGAELERQIVAGDAEALLARVPASGLRCAGRIVPREKVARDLRREGAWLHGVFFGSGGTERAPTSLASFLRTAKEVAIVVSFHPDGRARSTGRPCLDFRAKDLPTPGAPLCFEERDGRWWFTESLYPCG
jgi:hypothetical protein